MIHELLHGFQGIVFCGLSRDQSEVSNLLAIERERDPSDQGRRRALSVVAARPDSEQQRRLMAQLLDDDSGLTVADARAIAAGLFPDHQYELQLEITGEALERLQDVSDNIDPGYFGSITGGLLGTICDASYLDQLEGAIRDSGSLHPSLQRSLKDMRFEVVRCLAIGAYMSDGG